MNTISGEADMDLNYILNSISFDEFAADLDENKAENKDSNIGYVDASNTNANITGGTSKTDDNKVENCDSNISSVAASNTNANVTGGSSKSKNHGGHQVGNKKDGPARNGNAERHRRGKFNKYLLGLRSVVPKISKIDQASILVDAIDYLKELRQKVSKHERELDLPPAATPPVTTGFSHLTLTAATIPSCSTKDLVPIQEPARVVLVYKGCWDTREARLAFWTHSLNVFV
nr:transcription factor ICE1 [Tanacetum cinerariifolium]